MVPVLAILAGLVGWPSSALSGPAGDLAAVFRDICLGPESNPDARADADGRLTRLSPEEAARILPGQEARIWRAAAGAATAYLILRGGEVPTAGGAVTTSLCTLAIRGVDAAPAANEIAAALELGEPDETRAREDGGDTFLHSVQTEDGRFEVLISTNPKPNASVPVMLSAVPR